MRPTVFICINGIKTRPGRDDGWTDRAVTELMTQGLGRKLPIYAEKYEYFTLASTRRFRQQARAAAIAAIVHAWCWRGAHIVLVAHSNGGDLAERVIELCPYVPFKSVHLFAPAADGEILSRALANGQVGHAYLHGQTNDPALKLGRISRRLLGWAKLGYGDLGLRVKAFAEANFRCTADESDAADHGIWLEPGSPFRCTINQMIEREFPPVQATS
jgi:hypothetical protein